MKMLVTLDGSALSETALELVRPLAKAARAEVHLLRVGRPPPRPYLFPKRVGVNHRSVDDMRGMASWTNSMLGDYPSLFPQPAENYDQAVVRVDRELEVYLREKGAVFADLPVEVRVILSDNVPEAIISYAKDNAFDLIAMATRGRSRPTALLLGSVARRVVAARVAPVMLVRSHRRPLTLDALVFDEEAVTAVERCRGPDWVGKCPRATPGEPTACAGRWVAPISASGTVGGALKIAPDEQFCPLAAVLGEVAISRRIKQPSRSPTNRAV